MKPGWYWVKLAAGSDVQIVHVLSSAAAKTYIFFTADAGRLEWAEFEQEYPNAVWGARLEPPIL